MGLRHSDNQYTTVSKKKNCQKMQVFPILIQYSIFIPSENVGDIDMEQWDKIG